MDSGRLEAPLTLYGVIRRSYATKPLILFSRPQLPRNAPEFLQEAHSYKAVKNILANGLDKIEPEQLSANQPSLPLHANIRGNDYYHSKEER